LLGGLRARSLDSVIGLVRPPFRGIIEAKSKPKFTASRTSISERRSQGSLG